MMSMHILYFRSTKPGRAATPRIFAISAAHAIFDSSKPDYSTLDIQEPQAPTRNDVPPTNSAFFE